MNFNVEIERYSLFKDENGTNLRYSEFSPHKECKDYQKCNCTKNVSKRPEGEPLSITTNCKILTKDKERELDFAADPMWRYTFRWKEKDIIKEDFGYIQNKLTGELSREPKDSAHAYFWRNENGLQIEISKKDYGFADCFFGHILFGNKIDTTELVNGHAPSQIIKPESIDNMDIMAYECLWEVEAIRIFQRGEESLNWWKFLSQSDKITLLIQSHLINTVSVDQNNDIINSLVISENLLPDLQWNIEFLSNILNNLEKTEMYSCSIKCYKESHEKEGRFLVDSFTGKTIKKEAI